MEPFTKGWHIYDVPVYTSGKETPYTTHDDLGVQIVVYITYALLALGAVMQIVKVVRRKRGGQ
jgi:hypothetical protein